MGLRAELALETPHGNHLHPKWHSVPPGHLGHEGRVLNKGGGVRAKEEGGGGRIIIFWRRPEECYAGGVCFCPCASLIVLRRAPLFYSHH